MGRRANNEGSIYKRSDGRWTASLSLDGGRRKAFYGRTRQDVARKLTTAQKARDDGLPVPGERQTVEQFMRDWLVTVKSAIRGTTWERYESYVRVHIAPDVGSVPLARLSPARLQQLLSSRLESGSSPATVRQLRALMRKALQDAVRWGLLARNVASLTTPPRIVRQEIRALSQDEVRSLLVAAKAERLECLYVLAVTTGMRQGELLGLRWRDLDLEQQNAQVQQALHRVHGRYVFNEPKTSKSRRNIALTRTAVEALRRHRVRQAGERLKMGVDWLDSDLVFTNGIGGPVDAGNLRTYSFKPLLDRAGLPRVRFHDLRHTAATLMLSRGIHPKIVSEMLGHSQISITLDLYSHVTPTMQREAAEAMDALISG